jgi:hypothetical protein
MEAQESTSNGKIKMPKNSNVIVNGAVEEYEDSFTDLDEFDLAKIFVPQVNMDLSPTPSPEMTEQIDGLISKGKTFRTLNEKFVEKFVIKGNQELYELLGSIYGYMLTINESPYRDHIMKKMREHLAEESNLNLQEATPIETVVVRFIVPSDRQTAFNYARVLKVAFAEKIVAKNLPGYISGRGGITKIQDTQANEEVAKEKKTLQGKKNIIYRKILLAKTKLPAKSFAVSKSFVIDLVGAGNKSAMFEFALVTKELDGGFRVHQVVNVPKAVGESWIDFIASRCIPDDRVDEAQIKLDDMREKLGITNGYGMMPTDKGYKPLVDFSHTEKEGSNNEIDVKVEDEVKA